MNNNTLGPELFAIVEVEPGTTPPNTILTGPMDMLMQHIPDTVARTNEMRKLDLARFDHEQIENMQAATRAVQVSAFCDGIARLTRRVDELEEARAAQARADEEEEQKRIQDYLDSLPSPDDPDPFQPSGDLHQVTASEPVDEQQPEQSDQGTLPEELRKGAPPASGTDPVDDPAELAYPETPKQRAPAVFE